MKIHSEQAGLPKSTAIITSQNKRIWITAWMVTAVFILSNSATPLYMHWQHDMGFSNGTLTFVFAAYIAGLLSTLLVAGQLSDRFGRKALLLPGIIAAVVSCILFATASTVIILLSARFLSGIAVGVIVTAGMASVVDAADPNQRKSAALAASVAMVLGAGLGPLLSGVLAGTVSQPVVPIYLIQLAILMSAFSVAASLPARRTKKLEKRSLRMPSIPAANRTHLALGIAVFAPGISATSFILSLGPSMLAKLLAVTSPLVAGGTACLMFLTATGIQFALKKLPIRTIFLIGAAATILSMVCMTGAVNTSIALLLVLAAIFAGAGQGLGQLGGLTLIGLHVPEERRAEANAVLNIGGYIPAALLPVSTGYLIDLAGLSTGAAVFAAILAAAAAAGGLFVFKRLNSK